jgi:pyrrolysine biosynthesis protein PylC
LKVAIAGGKLQGVEASFLARDLGWETVVIDHNPSVLARGLCDSFFQCDIVRDQSTLCEIIRKADFVVPALENVKALKSLTRCASSVGVPFVYDEKAHFISRSKKRSKRFIEKIGVAMASSWPQCELPVMIKPSNLSGSQGVRKLMTKEEVSDFLKEQKGRLDRWVMEEYLEGPSYSLEVFGFEGRFDVLQVTELKMDSLFDCKRVLAPARLSKSLEKGFKMIARTIAERLHLKGIMDVEVINHHGTWKVLEIDARLPSQTPIAVLKSTGINMLEILGGIFVKGALPPLLDDKPLRGVIYEQIRVSDKGIEVLGEHIMADAGPLKRVDQFFGADVALTNFEGGKLPWVATLIMTGKDRREAWLKRRDVIKTIRDDLERLHFDKRQRKKPATPNK